MLFIRLALLFIIKNFMRHKKLSIEKFTISKLKNPSKIRGGNNTGGSAYCTPDRAQTETNPTGETCGTSSQIPVPPPPPPPPAFTDPIPEPI